MPNPRRVMELRERYVNQGILRGWVLSDNTLEIDFQGVVFTFSIDGAKALRSLIGEYFATAGEEANASPE